MDVTRRTVTQLAATFVSAVLTVSVLTACSLSGDGGSEADVPRVALMHVGTDHIPPSLGALATQLETEFGWDMPDPELNRCVEEKRKSCVFEGENVTLIWRNLEPDEADPQAEVFVGQGVDVIVAYEDKSIDAAQKATAGMREPIPIVFLHPSDPVRQGLVESLSRPGSNLTGVYGPRDIVGKQLELYELLVPRLERVLTLVDPEDPTTERLLEQYQAAAAELPRPLQLVIREVSTAQDLRRVFGLLRPGEVDGAFLLSPSLRLNHSALTIQLAKRAGLPVQAHRKEWVEQGALYSYGIDLDPIGRAGARYVDSVLRGTPPAELPVEEVSTTEFAINLATAARLGIKVPQDMIIRADQVYR
jgi:putative tryptophan/tyrosine transport system substrate-binding protein